MLYVSSRLFLGISPRPRGFLECWGLVIEGQKGSYGEKISKIRVKSTTLDKSYLRGNPSSLYALSIWRKQKSFNIMIHNLKCRRYFVSLCACERVTSDFQGIARVENYVAQKKKYDIVV